jgi:hypothetical protein
VSYLVGSAFIQIGIFDEDRTSLWRAEWSYQCRGVHLQQSASGYIGLWPSSKISSGDPTSPLTMLGQDSCQGARWSEWEIGTTGAGGPSVFLAGRTVDINSNPLTGVKVQGFVTSSEVFVGQTTSDSNANYSLGSQYIGVAHYLVAYLPGSPDVAGTTVNTLIPV